VRSHGIDVISIDVVPTPLTYFAAHVLPVDGLCMITGSHNPPEYNGFKVGIGEDHVGGPEVQELKARVAQARDGGRTARETEHDIITPYIHFVVESLGMTPRPLRVVCDAGNGTGGIVGPRLFAPSATGHRAVLQPGRELPEPPPRSHGGGKPARSAEEGRRMQGGPRIALGR